MANLAIGEMRKDYEIVSECLSTGQFAKSYRAKKADKIVFFKQYKSPKPTVSWYRDYIRYQKELKRRIESSSVKDFCYEFIDFFEATRPPKHREVSKEYFQVFEWVDEGKNLSHIIAELKENPSAYTWKQRLIWAKVIMASIAQLHDQQIAHIDLKPENLLLIPADIVAGYRLKLIDMDFSVLNDKQAPWHGISGYVGTPDWLSPEHIQGKKPDSTSDVFTCGLILYDLLGQGNPYMGLDAEDYKEKVIAHSAEKILLSDAMPEENDRFVIDVLYHCLSVDASERPTAKEVSLALNGADYSPEEPEVEIEPVSEETETAQGHLELHFDAGTMILAISTVINMRTVKKFGEDSQFWDKEKQMILQNESGKWSVTHNNNAVNETLLNGKSIKFKQVLKNGDQLAVGKEEKGIVKMPIMVKIV